MHGCSRARTKSMAVANVSAWLMVLTFAGEQLFEIEDERFIVLKEKSCGRLQPDIFIR